MLRTSLLTQGHWASYFLLPIQPESEGQLKFSHQLGSHSSSSGCNPVSISFIYSRCKVSDRDWDGKGGDSGNKTFTGDKI